MQCEPTHLFYLMSFACNERCSKCSHWRLRPAERPLDPCLVIPAFDELPGLVEFCIVGGEPLIFAERVLALIEGARRFRFRTVVVTNGVLLDERFVRHIAQCNVHVVVSVDTVKESTWQMVRGRPTRERVLGNLRNARKWLAASQLSGQSVLAKETADHLAGVQALCEGLGIHHSIQDYTQDGFGGQWTPMAPAKKMVSDTAPCVAGGRNVSVLPNGDVFTCFQQPRIPGCERPLGNITRDRLSTLLKSEYAREVLAAMGRCNLPCRVLKCNQPQVPAL